MNDDISRLLQDAAPEGPNPDAWADSARRRSGRRRTIAAVLTSVAAVALVVPLAVTMAGGPDTTAVQATPVSTRGVESAPGALQPPECLDAEGGLVDHTGLPVNPLPPGATRIWLCAEAREGETVDGTPVQMPAVVGAPEPLTVGTEEAVAAFNALGQIIPKSCPAALKYEAAVVVEYPDGGRYVLAGSDSGCDAVGGRGGWRSYLATLSNLWTAQRDTKDDTFMRDVQVCPATESLLLPRASEATRGYACTTSSTGQEYSQRALPGDLVADMAEEISGVATLRAAGWPPDPGSPTLVLLNAHGDPVWLTRTNVESGNPAEWWWVDAEGDHSWTPSPELATRIEDVLS